MLRLLPSIYLCLITFSVIEARCRDVYNYGVSEHDREIIVKKHNELRRLLSKGLVDDQPQACKMKHIKYDKELEKKAQEIADTCVFEHVEVQDGRWQWVGQNLYTMMSTDELKHANWDEAIESWFDEHKDYHYPDKPTKLTGHYTEIAWAKTHYVGCGYTSYIVKGEYRYQGLYVCNYGPGGNIIGEAPYKVDEDGHCV